MARKKETGGVDPNAWMVTFSDLLTLMLTFFVLLLSMSSMDSKSLKEAFETFLEIAGTDQVNGPPIISSGDPRDHYMEMRKSVIKNLARSGKIGSEMLPIKGGQSDVGYQGSEGGNELETADDDAGSGEANEGGREKREEMPGIEIIVVGDKLLVRFPSNITFESGSADLKPVFRDVLKVLAETVRENQLQVLVEGHTDDRPISTLRYPSNWELSLDRGARVARYLVEHCNIQPASIAAAGYADRRPIATNKTIRGRARNRRVDLILQLPEQGDMQEVVPPNRST